MYSFKLIFVLISLPHFSSMNEGVEQLRGLVNSLPKHQPRAIVQSEAEEIYLDVKKVFLTVMKMKSSPQKVLSDGTLQTATIQWIGKECFFIQSILGIQDCSLSISSLILLLLHYVSSERGMPLRMQKFFTSFLYILSRR